MEEYDRADARAYNSGNNLFSEPSDGKLFYHKLSGGDYYKGAVISDSDWDRIIIGVAKYSSSGTHVLNSERLYSVGATGYGSVNFKNPSAVAVTYYDSDEICVYVADQLNNRVQRFLINLDNGSVRGWSSLAAGSFNYPSDVEVDHKNDLSPGNDELWVADTRNNRIVRMNYSGSILDCYGTIKTGTEGTAGNIKSPKSLSLFRYMDEVYNHTIVVSDNGNKKLVSLNYNGGIFTQECNIPYPNPSVISCVQFDQASANVYAVDKLNSKIYKYMYRPVNIAKLELCGEYGSYGTGNHQLKHPVSIHPIVPMETSPNYYRGANFVGIIEEWTDLSGLKVGYEGVDILDINVATTPEQHRMDFSYKIPSGIGYITETIKTGTENLLTVLNNEIFQATNRSGHWNGDYDPNSSSDDFMEPGIYTLEAKIVSYWDLEDYKTTQRNFYILPGGPFAPLPYTTSFGSSFSDYWEKDFSWRVRTTNDYGPHTGTYHVVMSAITDIIPIHNTNWAYLKVGFQNTQDQHELSFWWKDFGDENHSEDAIYFSDNAGNDWKKVYQLYPESNSDNVWRKVTLDIDELCSANALSQSNRFCIRFSQRDDRTVDHNDGIAFDDVSVSKITLKSSQIEEISVDNLTAENNSQNRRIENYPNPFNTTTTIHYFLDEDCNVAIEVFDISGQKVAILGNTFYNKGDLNIIWDGKSSKGITMPNGTYFCRLHISGKKQNKVLISSPILKVN